MTARSLPDLDLASPEQAGRLVGRSLAIAASAGSGKTFTLATLVAGFLGRDGNRPHQVVACTFNREAAADLRIRILAPLSALAAWSLEDWEGALEALREGWEAWDDAAAALAPGRMEVAYAARQWASGGDWPAWTASPAAARAHWTRARREAEGMEISTVHSLAQRVLRQRGVDAASVLDAKDPRLERLMRQAGREAWSLEPAHPDAAAARRLLAWAEAYDPSGSRWAKLCEGFDAHVDALGRWREDASTADLAQVVVEAVDAVLDAYRPFAEAPERAAKRNAKDGAVTSHWHSRGLARKFVPAPPPEAPFEARLQAVEALAAALTTQDGRFSAQHFDPAFIEAMAPLDELPGLVEEWLSRLLERAFRRFEALKEARGLLSFGDLARRALELLRREPPAEAPRLLLVDEYQDINPVQDAFLKAFGSPALVVVGDRKQAIYGFRGGESRHLAALLEEARSTGGAFCLPKNRRSASPIVEVANAFVEAVVPGLHADSADPDGLQDPLGHGAGERRVAFAQVASSKRGADLQATAAWVAGLTGEAGWAHVKLAPAAARRRAILVKARTGLGALRRDLQKVGVEPLIQSTTGFWESPGVRLLSALLEAVAHPDRPLPLAAVLRSPWVGATDADLAALAAAWGGTLPGLGALDPAALRPELRPGAAWAKALLGRGTARILGQGLARPGLLELLAATRAHGRLEPERARRNLDAFLGLAFALSPDPATAFAQLQEDRRGGDRGDAPAPADAADWLVQTIHGSKGLEYDDVLLPLLRFSPKGPRKGDLSCDPDTGFLALGWKLGNLEGPRLRARKEEEEVRRLAEGLNLLYVGLTRARSRMVILHQWEVEAETDQLVRPRTTLELRTAKTPREPRWHNLGSDLLEALPDLPVLAAPPPPSAPVRTEPPPRRGPAEVPALEAGEAPEAFTPERAERQRRGEQLHALLREVLVRHGQDPASAEAYLAGRPGADLVRHFLEALAAKGWDRLPRRTELPLAGAARDTGGLGRADLVVWEPDRTRPEVVRVVDFKLARDFGDADLDAYARQLAGYKAALAAAHPGVRVEGWLYALESALWFEV